MLVSLFVWYYHQNSWIWLAGLYKIYWMGFT